MSERRRGLGRGLGALIPSSDETSSEFSPEENLHDGRPVDLFFPRGSGPDGEAGNGVEGNGTAARQSSSEVINKDALRAPAVRPGTRSGGSRKGVPAAARGNRLSTDEVSRETGAAGDSPGALVAVPGATFAEVPLDQIRPNRRQPRTVFDEEDMAELVHSVREIGVLQPVVLRLAEDGESKYELVMGERRWRASRQAGLEAVPAIIRSTADDDLLRDALLENLHRSQLNPLEEAAAYQQLLDDFGCSHEELAGRIGRSRPQISNTLRLMNLPPLVQRRLAAGVLSAGHARALLSLGDAAEMERVAQRIVSEGLSVRATEELVAVSGGNGRPSRAAKPRAGARHERLDYLESSLANRLDTNVKITLGARKGKVSIEFASVDDLNRIMAVLDPE
jgi:ParB family chromosome partitioning protein